MCVVMLLLSFVGLCLLFGVVCSCMLCLGWLLWLCVVCCLLCVVCFCLLLLLVVVVRCCSLLRFVVSVC